MIRLHREGRRIIVITLVVLLVANIATILISSNLVNYLVSLLSIVLLVLIFRFFRIPVRRPFVDDKAVIAPADGKVVAIEKVHLEEHLNRECIQVSIFMSIHDVHINFFPVSGIVDYVKYHPGSYLVARHPKSSSLNEHYSTGIQSSFGPVLVRQIAGYVARRISCYAREDSSVSQGEEMGFIKFGSRLDLFLPLNAQIEVSLNQRVTGSITPVARIK